MEVFAVGVFRRKTSGDTAYWSERNSKLYDGETSFALKRQNQVVLQK